MSSDNERWFPDHKIANDIGLAEFNLAASRMASDDLSITWSINASVAIATGVSYLSFQAGKAFSQADGNGIDPNLLSTFFILAIVAFSYVSMVHIVHLIRSRVFSERKIIVLRRMLGVSYGNANLVLPNWRIEGADNPFVIRIFPGFLSYRSFSVHIVLLSVSLSIVLLWESSYLPFYLSEYGNNTTNIYFPYIIAMANYFLVFAVFRYSLREQNEKNWLFVARLFSFILRVPLERGIEYKLYRIKLDVAEVKRLKYSFDAVEKFAIAIEDREFFEHGGLNRRGLARALKGYLLRRHAGGGSSITQQFARSNFILKLQPPIRRKIVEIFLAKWVESIMCKKDILEAYLTTARFDYKTYGFHRAYRKLFLEEETQKICDWEAFILIERLANIRPVFLGNRVYQIMRRLIDEQKISLTECRQALKFYGNLSHENFMPKDGDISPNAVLTKLEANMVAVQA